MCVCFSCALSVCVCGWVSRGYSYCENCNPPFCIVTDPCVRVISFAHTQTHTHTETKLSPWCLVLLWLALKHVCICSRGHAESLSKSTPAYCMQSINKLLYTIHNLLDRHWRGSLCCIALLPMRRCICFVLTMVMLFSIVQRQGYSFSGDKKVGFITPGHCSRKRLGWL